MFRSTMFTYFLPAGSFSYWKRDADVSNYMSRLAYFFLSVMSVLVSCVLVVCCWVHIFLELLHKCKELTHVIFFFIPNIFLVLKPALSEINITTTDLFWLLLLCYVFLLPFTFNLLEYLYLKWVTYRWIKSYFLILSDYLSYLIGIFREFTLERIIYIFLLIYTMF